MKITSAHDLYESASDLTAGPRRLASEIDVPDFDFSDAADSVVDLAGDVVDRAGEVVSVVGVQGRRGVRTVFVTARRNPGVTIGIVAVLIALVAVISVKKRSNSEKDHLASV